MIFTLSLKHGLKKQLCNKLLHKFRGAIMSGSSII